MVDEKSVQDLSSILVNDQIKECTIDFKGQKFNFKYREIPWVQITKIASNSIDYSKKKVAIDRSEYDILYLEASLVEAPWPIAQTRMVVRKINSEFGALLRSRIIPEPFEAEDDELKNE